MLKKIFKILCGIVGFFVLLVMAFIGYVRWIAIPAPPEPSSVASLDWAITEPSPGLYKIGDNWFRKSESGLYELYVNGKPFERGVVIGKLTKDLVQHQEEVFTAQLNQMVPSSFYREFLKYAIGWFNRDLSANVPDEFKLEIFGVSQAADHKFDYIAKPYPRMLNYHAAHDIGHALQNISLVGCTSFATWGAASEDSSLIIGRNFDFTLGEDFGRDKIIAFYHPDQGHKFMMVTFGGMTGVLSGMNDQGLTVTINAAKSEIPGASATPVSIVAREILQYAATIDEAYTIAGKRKMFVSESFLIGSAKEGKASLIEKTPELMDKVAATGNFIISTNHFQGYPLGDTELNKEHLKTSASPYRYARVQELMERNGKNSVIKTAALLRNQLGLDDKDIGMANEKSVNQLVAHHSIIFQPQKLLVWVSTSPWQLGKYVCYDLKKIFGMAMSVNREIYEPQLTISADSFLATKKFQQYRKFSPFHFPFGPYPQLQPDSLMAWNPNSYEAYLKAGDYLLENDEFARAVTAYEKGLSLEIATMAEREHMQKNLSKSKAKLK